MFGFRRTVMGAPFTLFRFVFLGCVLLVSQPAFAWGPEGHRTVAAIAQRLLTGTKAAGQAKAILGAVSLEDAAVWADCAKGVKPSSATPGAFTYEGAGAFPECKVFETPAGEAGMIDFVKRNFTSCTPKPDEESCHKQYHYTDIATQHDHYDKSFHGARTDDIVAAVAAAIHVLKGDPAPAPFSFKDRHEALLVLVHYVGDIHQPLHVGAIYLDVNGHPVNPDAGSSDPNTETRGGNKISVVDGDHPDSHFNLHFTWDTVSPALSSANLSSHWLSQARKVPPTAGQISRWSAAWASDTQKEAVKAFKKLTFGKRMDAAWTTTLPVGYAASMDATKRAQLTKAGARLAQLLKAIWP